VGDQEHRRHELQSRYESLEKDRLALQQTLFQKEKDKEDCDDTRAQLVVVAAKVASTHELLDDCLNTKDVLNSKIDAANEARAKAEWGLEDCLKAKARLKAAVEDCHRRRDATRKKLQECLDRKKVLKKKIEECHKKRDEARAKLAKCLERKKELKKKIAEVRKKLKSALLQAEDHAAVQQATTDANDALEMLRESNEQFREFLETEKEASAALSAVVHELEARSEEEHLLLDGLAAIFTKDAEASKQAEGLAALLENVRTNLEVEAESEASAAASSKESAEKAANATK
jgi:chromosome segregation ATPase